ncbi:MAG TPA: right-handed parallel beta-helix repeat-containing protein [Polyangiaceae bacterium]|nr:right-handed parallel beta-helix repeat-containing protein [Polyangiaceae bacterium]
MRLSRAFAGVSLLLAGCQIIGGIEVRDEYVAPVGGAGADAGGNGGSDGSGGTKPEAGSGGDDASGGSSAGSGVVEGGAAGAPPSGGTAGEPDAGAGGTAPEPPVVCGDGNPEGDEACDDGAQNGLADKCDTSCAFVCAGACPLRVDPTITTPGDGSSWANAMGSLQAAVTQQQAASGGEVWTKQATITAVNSATLLTLGSSVTIYGGFEGTEVLLSQRPTPTEATVTVLDAAGLAYPAVKGAGGATLDGFLIKNASGNGGSAFTATSVTGLVLRNVWFKGNASKGGGNCGGALVLNGGGARLENCRFEGNKSDGVGGAICLENSVSVLTIVGSSFVDNEAVGSGGAIHAFGSYSPSRIPTVHVQGATFIGNKTTTMQTYGGAIYVSNANLDVSDSDFMSNQAALGEGAALYCDSDGVCSVRNSTFVHNLGFRAAVHSTAPNMKVVGSTFAFNDANCPDKCDVSSTASLQLQNSVLVQSEKIYMQSTSGVISSNNCSIFIAGGLGAKPSPFVDPLVDTDGNGVPEYLLAQPADNGCLDIGNDANATAAGVAWATLTTSANNCLDKSPVDAGRHYAPTKPNTKTCE